MTRTKIAGYEDRVSLSLANWIALIGLLVILISPVVVTLVNHERRITIRESNAFTSQEGNKLAMAVAEQSLAVAEMAKDMVRNEGNIDRNDQRLDSIEREQLKLLSQVQQLVNTVKDGGTP